MSSLSPVGLLPPQHLRLLPYRTQHEPLARWEQMPSTTIVNFQSLDIWAKSASSLYELPSLTEYGGLSSHPNTVCVCVGGWQQDEQEIGSPFLATW